ncbi:MAG: efflux RND transporter periplasmic adaptor subunit [Bacteroidales bacterium]|jgi:RND family efflux transporter MFP subunit|nr:efflux RND transporter periplasmic adaptor subunit [Bacteroidales bacterium]
MNKICPIIVLLFLLHACTGNTSETSQAQQAAESSEIDDLPEEVSVQRLDYADFNYELISNGIIASIRKAELRFQSSEIIRKIYVRNGQFVEAGQPLAELDKFRLEIALKQAVEALERARLDLQEVLIGQGYSLNDSANIPPNVMRLAKIRSNFEQSQTNHVVAKHNFDAATLYAPFAGVIANLTAKEYNQPGGEAFCVVIDNRSPEVVFNILETELALIKVGDQVLVSPFSQLDFIAEGRISEINPMIDKNGMVRIKATLANKDNRFYEGMNVRIRVQRLLGSRLAIPKSALVLRTNRKVVFTLKDGTANWVYVETAQENSNSYVIVDGLKPGDTVIYQGNMNLAHGTPVRVRN